MQDTDINSQIPDDKEDYHRIFRKRIFRLLKWGYDRLDNSFCRTAEESDDYQVDADGYWVEKKIIKELNHCYSSKHHRALGKSPIAIFHCFLVFI